MKTNAYFGSIVPSLFLTLGLAACGGSSGGNEETSDPSGSGGLIGVGATVDINGDGVADGKALDANGDGIPESIDRDGDGKADGVLPAGTKVVAGGDTGGGASTNGGGGTTNGSTGVPIDQEDGGGADNGGSTGTVVVETEVKILCGKTESKVDVANGYVCCDSLSGGKWAEPTITAEGGCNAFSSPGAETVPSKCDDKDDCGTSFCCFTYNLMGPPAQFVARAYGRRCLTEASCNMAMGGEGQGQTFSCNDEGDCPKQFPKCVPEAKGKTNADTVGRAWVKVCSK